MEYTYATIRIKRVGEYVVSEDTPLCVKAKLIEYQDRVIRVRLFEDGDAVIGDWFRIRPWEYERIVIEGGI